MRPLRAAVVAVGEELLLGDVVNGNAAPSSAALAGAGVPVVTSSAVGDDVARIVTVLRRALEDADVVVVTGGLGPTSDDLTRDALAQVAGVPLQRCAELEQQLRETFGGRETDEVLRQADVPAGATVLPNPAGTAPGLRVEVGEQLLVALPGPPHEMRAVAAPLLAELAARTGVVVRTRTLSVVGRGEPFVAAAVEAAVDVPQDVALSYLAGGGVVRVRLTATAPSVEQADERLAPLVRAAEEVLGDDVAARDEQTLEQAVLERLRAAGATVALAESLTGGMVTAALTAVAGASDVLRGGVVSYATDLKAGLAGVPAALLDSEGAVSPRTAAAMAAGVRERCGATYGVALTGVAGPSPQEGHPAGTVHVAVAGPAGEQVRTLSLSGDRSRVRALAATAALDLLRRAIVE